MALDGQTGIDVKEWSAVPEDIDCTRDAAGQTFNTTHLLTRY